MVSPLEGVPLVGETGLGPNRWSSTPVLTLSA